MRKCDCCGSSHREESLADIGPCDRRPEDARPDHPLQSIYLCAKGLRERERTRKSLERGRRVFKRSAAA